MEPRIREVDGYRDLRKFIFLPEKLHAGHDKWVPPLYKQEFDYFDPKKNRYFAYCKTILLLAFRSDEVVGRVFGIINPHYNDARGERTVRFACLEASNDRQVVGALLDSVEQWARRHGMDKVVGPYGFSDQDPEGFLIEGFEHPPTIATNYNFQWMPAFVEDNGYSKEIDYVTYRINVPTEMPGAYIGMKNRIMERGGFNLVELKDRADVGLYAKPAFQLMNDTYSRAAIYGFSPLDEQEMEELVERYRDILDPRFLKVVVKGREVVAFIIGLPDMMEGIRRARGRLLPFGFLKILRARKNAGRLDLLLGAVKEEYRRMGLDFLLMQSICASAIEAGMRVVDMHHQMETNTPMRLLTERYGGSVYKRYRVYGKKLGNRGTR